MRVLALFLLLCLCAAPVLADETPPPTGTVTAPVPQLAGTYTVKFPSVAAFQSRDVFNVIRNGKVVGQAMAMGVDPNANTITLAGLASFPGKMQAGDQVVFLKHADMPAPPPQLPPSVDPSTIPQQPGSQPMDSGPPDPYDINSLQPGDTSAPLYNTVPYYYYPWYHEGQWGPSPSYQPYYPHDSFKGVQTVGVPGASVPNIYVGGYRGGGGRR